MLSSFSLSPNILLYKYNAVSILTKHLSHIVAVTFAVWGEIANLAWIFFSLLHNFIDDWFLPQVLAASECNFFSYHCLLLLATPCDLWNLSSLTRNQTCAPYSGNTESSLLKHQGSSLFPFLIKSRTFTFSLKGITLQLICSISELPALLPLCFGAIIK